MKTTTKFYFYGALLFLLFGATSCLDDLFIEGNGIRRTETRNDEGFNEIVTSGDFEIRILPGPSYSVQITAESNLLPYVSTYVDGKKLKIKTTGVHSLRQNYPIEIDITTPELNGLSLSGSGFIEAGYFVADDFYANVSGSGDIKLEVSCDYFNSNVSGSGSVIASGDAIDTKLVISGSGKIRAYNLEQNNCEAVISGSGDVYVAASRTIDARISGSGKVFYINYPRIFTSISGSGGVVNRN
jgi:hypothetical protein